MRHITLITVLILSLFPCAAQKKRTSKDLRKPVTITQWEVNDFSYQVRQKVAKPFQAEAYALVTDEAGEQKIPLFYNGDKEWIFRYSAATTGMKTFKIISSLRGLKGKKGQINVVKNTKADRHGGVITKSEDPRHFYYQDGTHYTNLAFECDFLYALDYQDEAMPKTKHLLDLVQQNGFNQIVMNVYAYGLDLDWVKDPNLPKHPEHNYGEREDIFPFLGSNSKPDYSTLNVDFFKNFDRVVSEMHAREIVSHLMIYVWNKRVNWPELGSEADDRYFDYVIKRYQAFPNILWDVSKEATSPIALGRKADMADYIRARALRIRELDAYKRLVSVHAYSFCRKNKDVVDFISTQDWKLGIYQSMMNVYKQFPDKPVFNIEHGGYEESPYNIFPGGYSNAEACLRRNYECLFAGTYTTYYWQGTSWNAIIHNPFEQPEGVYKPKFEYFKYMRGFMDKVRLQGFKPVTKYNSRGYNMTNYTDGVIIIYVPKEVHHEDVKRQLDKEFDYSQGTIQWFNTITGEYTPVKPIEFPHKYGFWDWRPWRNEADAIMIVSNLKQKKK